MDFLQDMAFAVIFRILKDRKLREKVKPALAKLYQVLGEVFPEWSKSSTESER